MKQLMVVSARGVEPDQHRIDAVIDRLDQSISRVVLQRQDPVSGLLPASTAHTIHGNYGDAWVRDCVYSVQCVWALALAHRRHRGATDRRAWELEQHVIALMRGLLRAMLRQAGKVERFKHSLDPLDALSNRHAQGHRQPMAERTSRSLHARDIPRFRRVLMKDTAGLTEFGQPLHREKSAFSQHLEQHRSSMTFAQHEAITIWRVRFSWIDIQFAPIEHCQYFNAREAGSEVWDFRSR